MNNITVLKIAFNAPAQLPTDDHIGDPCITGETSVKIGEMHGNLSNTPFIITDNAPEYTTAPRLK